MRREQIEKEHLVRDIMVPVTDLVCGDNEDHAQELLKKHPDFNLIPITENGRLVAFIERGGKPVARKNIELHPHVIGDGTSVLRLIDILAKPDRQFCFVVKDDGICGYVHFSDLNNRLVNLSLFAIVGEYEHVLAEKLRHNVDRPLLNDRQQRKLAKLQRNNAEINWTTVLFFREVLQLAQQNGIISVKDHQIDLMSDSRNRICHAPRLLIEGHGDVQRIAQAKDLWLEYLRKGSRPEK